MLLQRTSDPLPLSARQVRELTAATARELAWGLPQMNKAVRRWSRLAERIPDEPIRADALQALNRKRGHVAGAAAFTIIPRERSEQLLLALFSHQVIIDFLDCVHERHPTLAGGESLHLAISESLTPGEPISDYYAHHPWKDDGGYLRALVEDCRRCCEALPSFELVQAMAVADAAREGTVLTLNHLLDTELRDRELRRFVEAEYPGQTAWSWFELTAAACGQLNIFVLLALAAEPRLESAALTATYDAYWPLMPLVTTMLDSFVDQAEDGDNGNHQYVSHYRETEEAVRRLSELIGMTARELMALPNGQRHAVLFGCMVTLYLTKDSARTPAMAPDAQQLVRAGGSLPRALMPVLRLWRRAYSQSGF